MPLVAAIRSYQALGHVTSADDSRSGNGAVPMCSGTAGVQTLRLH